MLIHIEGAGIDGEDRLKFLDEVSGWSLVDDVSLTKQSSEGSITAAIFLVTLIVVSASKSILVIAKTVKYIQDNFHRPVVIDFTGDQPRITTLPNSAGLRGKTFVRSGDGQVELAPDMDVPQLAEEFKALLPPE